MCYAEAKKKLIFIFKKNESPQIYIQVTDQRDVLVSSYKTQFKFSPINELPFMIKDEIIKARKPFVVFFKKYQETTKEMNNKINKMMHINEVYEYVKDEMCKKLGMDYEGTLTEEAYADKVK